MNIGVKKDYLFKKYTAKLKNIFPDTGWVVSGNMFFSNIT